MRSCTGKRDTCKATGAPPGRRGPWPPPPRRPSRRRPWSSSWPTGSACWYSTCRPGMLPSGSATMTSCGRSPSSGGLPRGSDGDRGCPGHASPTAGVGNGRWRAVVEFTPLPSQPGPDPAVRRMLHASTGRRLDLRQRSQSDAEGALFGHPAERRRARYFAGSSRADAGGPCGRAAGRCRVHLGKPRGSRVGAPLCAPCRRPAGSDGSAPSDDARGLARFHSIDELRYSMRSVRRIPTVDQEYTYTYQLRAAAVARYRPRPDILGQACGCNSFGILADVFIARHRELHSSRPRSVGSVHLSE